MTYTIALEEHLWTPELREALLFQTAPLRDDSLELFNHGPLAGRLLESTDARINAMDEAGVDMQVLSITTPGTQTLHPTLAVSIAVRANDHMAAMVAERPDRFAAFATLPTPDPTAAAKELVRAVRELGFVGAMLFPRTHDCYLDHDVFHPVFEAAADLGVPLYIHPQIAPDATRGASYAGFDRPVEIGLATGAWGWHADTGLSAIRLVLAGTFDRHPNLQLILGHWGEMLITYLDRISQIDRVTRLQRPFEEYVLNNMYITPSGIESYRMMAYCLSVVGADRILYSTDYPFVESLQGGARAFLDNAPISAADKEKIGYRNAAELLGIDVP